MRRIQMAGVKRVIGRARAQIANLVKHAADAAERLVLRLSVVRFAAVPVGSVALPEVQWRID
jgi:hypothetical protein